MKRENPIAKRSKQWMAESLFRLMQEKEYRSISIQEICEGANLVRQTFYTNFSSKEELLAYGLDLLFEEFYRRVLVPRPGSLEELIREIFVFCRDHREVNALLEEQQLSHLLWERLTISNQALREFLRRGDRPPQPEKERYIVAFFAGALYGMASAWFSSGMEQTPEEMARLTVEMMQAPFPLLGEGQ